MEQKFPETNWSQILLLRDHDNPLRPEILERMVGKYWKPVYHYVRALRRLSAEDAEDLTQQFFMQKIARQDFEKLTPERGSFRGFLKTALRNFLVSAERSARVRPALFPYGDAEADWKEHADRTPDEAFDRAWAWTVFSEAVDVLREEMAAAGKAAQFDIFAAYYLRDDDPMTYRDLAQKFGVSEGDVLNRLREGRQRLRAVLKKIVREYMDPDDDLENELAFIMGR